MNPYDQRDYALRFARGRRGAREAAARGDVLVVVDVLSFSSLVVTGVAHGAAIVPCRPGDEAVVAAAWPGAEVAVHREEVPARGRFSLSPPTLLAAAPGDVIVVGSPNGAACAAAAIGARAVVAASLLNASAAARVARGLAGEAAITVLACGERWADPDEDGALRAALEDDLGAGAVLAALGDAGASPEARAAAAQFRAVREDVEAMVWDCGSGRELRERGWEADVRHAARLDVYDVAPVLQRGIFLPLLAAGEGGVSHRPPGGPTLAD